MFKNIKNFFGMYRKNSINREAVKEYGNITWYEISGILYKMENGISHFEHLIDELYPKIIKFDDCFNKIKKNEKKNLNNTEWIRSMNVIYNVMKRVAVYRKALNELQIKFPHDSRISSFNKRLAYCEKDLLGAYNLMELWN